MFPSLTHEPVGYEVWPLDCSDLGQITTYLKSERHLSHPIIIKPFATLFLLYRVFLYLVPPPPSTAELGVGIHHNYILPWPYIKSRLTCKCLEIQRYLPASGHMIYFSRWSTFS